MPGNRGKTCNGNFQSESSEIDLFHRLRDRGTNVRQKLIQVPQPVGTGGARSHVALDQAQVVFQSAIQCMVERELEDCAGWHPRGHAPQVGALRPERGRDGRCRRNQLTLYRSGLRVRHTRQYHAFKDQRRGQQCVAEPSV